MNHPESPASVTRWRRCHEPLVTLSRDTCHASHHNRHWSRMQTEQLNNHQKLSVDGVMSSLILFYDQVSDFIPDPTPTYHSLTDCLSVSTQL